MVAFYKKKKLCFLVTCLMVVAMTSVYKLRSRNNKEKRSQVEKEQEIKETIKIHDTPSYEDTFGSRSLEIQERCKNRSQKVGSILSNTFKYNDDLKVVMCEVPKVASTTWQILLLRLGGFQANITKELRKKWAYSKIPNKHFKQLQSQTEALFRMTNYTTFFLTRHPFERLVSAYFDKLSNRSSYQYYKNMVGKQIAKPQAIEHLHGLHSSIDPVTISRVDLEKREDFNNLTIQQKREVIEYIRVMKSGEISFPQFVKFLVQQKLKNRVGDMDIHWRPQVQLCKPCAFNYSYILRFENITYESNKLLDYIQKQNPSLTSHKITFPGKDRPFVKNEETTQLFEQISKKDVQALREIYADDFFILKHDPYLYGGV
ncbi:carbohydrate sulfotransferase 11-like [Clavelina lepadiformis]|uniref:carbohydrate sulfotransferase 11-like n=1 Tax=Clavelina lepadiformis TaxID=159417 RepID=UPI00404139C7